MSDFIHASAGSIASTEAECGTDEQNLQQPWRPLRRQNPPPDSSPTLHCCHSRQFNEAAREAGERSMLDRGRRIGDQGGSRKGIFAMKKVYEKPTLARRERLGQVVAVSSLASIT